MRGSRLTRSRHGACGAEVDPRPAVLTAASAPASGPAVTRPKNMLERSGSRAHPTGEQHTQASLPGVGGLLHGPGVGSCFLGRGHRGQNDVTHDRPNEDLLSIGCCVYVMGS